MARYDPYILTSMLSSVVVLVMGICLLVVSVPQEPQLKTYRMSRRFLALAYLILYAIGQWEVCCGVGPGDQSLVQVFTVVAASFQALLFTYALITLIHPGAVTARKVLGHAVLISALSALLVTLLFRAPGAVFDTAFHVALGLYCLQVAFYISVFAREYRRYRHKLDNFFSGNEERRMRWVRSSFYMAAGVGIAAVLSMFVDRAAYMVFGAAYTVFYVYFAVKYINYVNLFHRIAPVVAAGAAPGEVKMNGDIHAGIGRWTARKGFLCPDITLETLARELHTNPSYLSRHINTSYGQNFRSWINSLRIGESQRLLVGREDLSIPEVGEAIGIPSSSSFYRQFSAVTGMTPAEYRRRFGSR